MSSGRSRGNLGSDLEGGEKRREEKEERRGGRGEGRTMDEEGWKERDGKRKEGGEGSMSDHHYLS